MIFYTILKYNQKHRCKMEYKVDSFMNYEHRIKNFREQVVDC